MSEWQGAEGVWVVGHDKENFRFYICDPSKNHLCAKTSCHLNGGECRHTLNKQCALYPEDKNNE